ncbi:hypothetical protein HN385_06890 [archaeon]|jgi:hypothetical protein|nr:hypothetical protein [archaeon]MBT6868581.1 hypothetical protein [archaeon]MBT7380430.1 hypothetical protein [archaeon]MBT7508762.1 hypothetical protein [archaeon]
MQNKKAQGSTFWIIIAAVIALIVMIVLLLMFTGKTNVLEKGIMDCEAKGGVCYSNSVCPDGTSKQSVFTCDTYGGDYVCCLGTPTINE